MFNKPKIYRRRPQLRRVVAIIAIVVASLFVLAVVLFFVLRGFMVYYEDGTASFGGRPPEQNTAVTPTPAPIRPPVNYFLNASVPVDSNVDVIISREPSFTSGDNDWTVLYEPIDALYTGFSLLIELPAEWQLELVVGRGFQTSHSMVMILDANGECIGAIAYNRYPDSYAGDIMYDSANGVYDLMPIYSDIARTPDHRVYVRSPQYQPVTDTEDGAVAVTIADYNWRQSSEYNWQLFSNKVILAHDNILAVYALVEFYDDALTDSQLKDIAVKVKLVM